MVSPANEFVEKFVADVNLGKSNNGGSIKNDQRRY